VLISQWNLMRRVDRGVSDFHSELTDERNLTKDFTQRLIVLSK